MVVQVRTKFFKLRFMDVQVQFNEQKLAAAAQEFGLRFVIVYGSHVSGTLHAESDFDLAVLGFRKIDFRTLLKLHGVFGEIFHLPDGMDLDLKSLDKTDPLFRYEVARNSTLLYGDGADYEEFKAAAFRAYQDARPLFELERQMAYKYQKHLNQLYAEPDFSFKKN